MATTVELYQESDQYKADVADFAAKYNLDLSQALDVYSLTYLYEDALQDLEYAPREAQIERDITESRSA
jgi:hypothetical protein